MKYITRLSYNSANWQHPTGDAQKHESAKTYNHKHGFGHEDWLFRSEWQIGGWRYAFLQGVNKSHRRLVEAQQAIDLTLFTINPNKSRTIIAEITEVECLSDVQAEEAVEEFRRRGWLRQMRNEVEDAGGDVKALGDTRWAKHILNVRFRLEHVHIPSAPGVVPKGHRILKLNRYSLSAVTGNDKSTGKQSGGREKGRRGSETLPVPKGFRRKESRAIDCSPEHARMQKQLMIELKKEYPQGRILREEDFIDVRLETASELMLFEIKSDLRPRSVIRQALGQILEYAFHPSRPSSEKKVRLIIVGRNEPTAEDDGFLSLLRNEFRLPLEYRTVPL